MTMLARSKQHAITLIRELDPAADPTQWRRDLRSANRQIWLGAPGYAAGVIETLHHMACCVMEMHDRHYIVFEANVDGDVETFLRELCEKCPGFVTRAFGQCLHRPNTPATDWAGFLQGGLRPYGIYHIGNTGRRAARILQEDKLLSTLARQKPDHMWASWSRSDAWRRLYAGLSASEKEIAHSVDPRPLLVRLNPLNTRTRERNRLGISLLWRALVVLAACAAYLALDSSAKNIMLAVGGLWGAFGLLVMTSSTPRLLAPGPKARLYLGHLFEAVVSGAFLMLMLSLVTWICIEYAQVIAWLAWLAGWLAALYAIVILVLLASLILRPLAGLLTLIAGFAAAINLMPGESAWNVLLYGLTCFGAAVFITLLVLFGVAVSLRRAEATDPTDETDTRADQLPGTIGPNEDRYLQNHLASLTVMKPGTTRNWVLGIVMRTINLLARTTENLGDLGVIASIHFGRFVVLNEAPKDRDDKGYLVFFGNYDGDWGSYLGDFKGAAGLSAIWSNTRGFPRTLWLAWNGGQNERQFKRYARNSQIESTVWYSAYPNLAVTRIDDATFTCEDLVRPLPRPPTPGFFGDLVRWWTNPLTEAELDTALRRLR